MILFLSQFQDKEFEHFAKDFQAKTKIECKYKELKDIYSSGSFSIECNKNSFTSNFENIDFDKIKLCLVNFDVIFYKELFGFKDDADKEYAEQEWNAAFLCLFETAKNTKFINPKLSKYILETEMEDILLLQKLGFDTFDTYLTNNAVNCLEINDLFNNNTVIKNVIRNHQQNGNITFNTLKKLDKLYLSPYIFQKNVQGESLIFLIVGDEVLTYNLYYGYICETPVGLKEKLSALGKEINCPIATVNAIMQNGNIYFHSINRRILFSQYYSIFKEAFTDALTKFLVKEYKN